MTVTYKGFQLKASSHNLMEQQKWDARVAIIKLQDNAATVRHTHTFTLVSTFNSKNEALETAYLVAKEIIDGIHLLNSLSKSVSNCRDMWLLTT